MAAKRRFEDIVEALRSYHPNPDIQLVQRAYMYSAKVHAGQTRKSGEPYLVHPLEVAYLLTDMRLDEASVCTGLLHDTVEDTLATLDALKEQFGPEIAMLVDGVTKLSKIRFDTDVHKQAENFRKMLVAMAKDIRVILVKLADRLHNMRTLEHLPPHKQRRIAQETMDIYAPIANRLGIHWVKSQLEDLAFRYLQPEECESLRRRVQTLTAARDAYVRDVVRIMEEELGKRHIKCEVQGRPKHLYSIHKKMVSRQIEFEQVYDVIAFRIMADSVGACYEILGHIHALWHPIPGRFKDYVAMPKPNQYQSLHTSVIGPGGERIEIQIRTHEMHRVAEEGIAAHWEYKASQDMGKASKEQFAWLRQLLEWQRDLDDPNEFLDTVKYDLFSDEVFAFTPKGQVIALTRGSTPVDFAFSIHTEVGQHCAGAKVNGRMVPLRYRLKNGDMVEIMTSAQQRPSKDWLNFVRTGRAKSKIRAYIRADERVQSKKTGEELLDKELKRNDLSLQKVLKNGQLLKVADKLRVSNVDGLYVAVGYGQITPEQVVKALAPELDVVPSQPTPLGAIFQKAAARRSAGGVVVQGIEDVLVRFGRCCNPLRGDPIIGFVTRGRGITVHMATCSRAIDIDPARRVDVAWDPHGDMSRAVTLRVLTNDRPGILATISQAFSDNGVNIAQANCKVTEANRAINTFEVNVKDTDQLRKVLGAIRALPGVVGVDRI